MKKLFAFFTAAALTLSLAGPAEQARPSRNPLQKADPGYLEHLKHRQQDRGAKEILSLSD